MHNVYVPLRGVVLGIKIGFLISFTHGGQFRRWSGLTFRCASFLSPPNSRDCINTNVGDNVAWDNSGFEQRWTLKL